MTEEAAGERIAKRLSRAGVCSRREAERWIAAGRISVDGHTVSEPGTRIGAGADIRVDGRPVAPAAAPRLWRFHKPAGVICSARDPEGRPTVFDRLPSHLPRVMTVGRLDLASEGLLLLTNDGGLARRLELPATGWIRRYRVRVFGRPDASALAALERGLSVDGARFGRIEATVDSTTGANAWLTVRLREGRNREIRRAMEHLGHPVSRLIRTAFGPFQLGNLPRGGVEEVPKRVLRDQLGKAHADRRGAA